MNMRLLIATGVYPPESGGPATYTKLLEDRLPEHGFEVSVLPFARVRGYPKIVRHLLYTVLVYLRAARADMVFAQDPVSVGLPVCIAMWLRRRPFVLKVVGDYAWEQAQGRFGVTDSLEEFQTRRYRFRIWLMRRVERGVARRAALLIVPSEYLAGIVRGWKVPRGRVLCIPNGVDFSEVPEEPHARIAGRRIVTVARLVPWKGIDALIDVVARESDWSLVVVGDGPDKGRLEARAREAGTAKRVFFAGACTHAQTLGWIASGEVFALNSAYEGMSHVLLEALYLGKPIVATNAGGNREVIENGVSGLLVSVGDTESLHRELSRILGDALLSHQLSQKAHDRAQDFSIENTVAATSRVLKGLSVN